MSDEGKKPDDKDDLEKKLTDDPAFQELAKAVKGLAILAQQGQTAATAQQESFKELLAKFKEEAPKAPEADPDAVNDLDNVGLIKLVVGEVGKVVDEKIGNIGESLNKTNQDLSDSKLAVLYLEILYPLREG